MKKLSIFLLGALGMMAATSCEEKIDPAVPQSNPQEPILTTGDVVSEATGALTSTAVLNLEDYRAEGATIPVMKLVETKDLPEGATVSYTLQLSDTEDFKRNVTLATTGTEVDGVETFAASAQEWNDAHVYLFGKSPKVKTMYYRVPVYVNLDGSDYRLQSADYYAAEGTIQETCMDNGFSISDAYYFLSDATSWALGDATEMAPFKFDHSDADVYDDPVFTFKFKLTDADFVNADGTSRDIYWKIASQEGMDLADWATGIYGPETNGDDNLVGMLVDVNAQAGKLTEPGQYKLTINMEEMTYEFEILLQPEVLYTPGGANGWDQLSSGWMQLDTKNLPSKGYYGLFPVDDQGFKICTENSWDDAYTYGSTDAAAALTGTLGLGQAGNNILVPAAGFYWASVEFDPTSYELTTYTLTPITSVGIIGSFAASGWGTDVEMTTADGGITWTAEVSLAAGNEWKIRFNNDWVISLGGEPGNPSHAVLDGDNYVAAETGDFIITLTTQPGIPVITVAAK